MAIAITLNNVEASSELDFSGVADNLGTLYIGSNTTDGSQVFTDLSKNSQVITVVGDAEHSTEQSLFGTSSIKPVTSSGYIYAPGGVLFTTGLNNFTIHFRLYWQNIGYSSRRLCGCISSGNGSSSVNLVVSITYEGVLSFSNYRSGGSFSFSPTLTVSPNGWHHVAIVRYNDAIMGFVDGVKGANVGDVTGLTFVNAGYPFSIGRAGSSGTFPAYNCYFEEFNFVNGVALWTEDFSSNLPAPLSGAPDYAIRTINPVIEASTSITAMIPTVRHHLVLSDVEVVTQNSAPTVLHATWGCLSDDVSSSTSVTSPTLGVNISGDIDFDIPVLELALYTSTFVDFGLPILELIVTGNSELLGTIDFDLPMLEVELFNGNECSFSLPELTLSISATTQGIATISMTIPIMQFTSTGYLSNNSNATFNVPAMSMVMAATTGIVGDMSLYFPSLNFNISALTGTVGQISYTLPKIQLDISAIRTGDNDIDFTLPILQLLISSFQSLIPDGESSEILRYIRGRIR